MRELDPDTLIFFDGHLDTLELYRAFEELLYPKQSVFEMKTSEIYPPLVAKAEKKGRTKAEVDDIITWLTGCDMTTVDVNMT